jgi:hypothetical protein
MLNISYLLLQSNLSSYVNFQAQYTIIVSSKKLLYPKIAMARPSIRIYVVSKEIATGTPTETAILQGSTNNENEANSNTDSSHGDPDVEPLSRELNNDRKSKALAQSSFENEYTTLLKRVKALEEYN